MELLVDGSAFRCRAVLIGESSVGKTSILSRLVQGRFDRCQSSTVGADYQVYVADVNSVKLEMQIWDTAGQEKFRSLGPIYYRNAVGAIAVFDVTNHESLIRLEDWIAAFTETAGCETVVAIVGNKADLASARQVSPDVARAIADERQCRYYETSACTGEGIDEFFREFAICVLQRRMLTKTPDSADLALAPTARQCGC
jgi:small GTP-binding protein